MSFYLVKSLDHAGYYGNVPEPLPGHEDAFEEWRLEQGDLAILNEGFADEVNVACGSLLDLGDADYFDVEQCEKLRLWLVQRLDRGCDGRLEALYLRLLEYAERARELGTGVVVEL